MKARGFFNHFIQAFGSEAVSWYSNAALWWPILILTSVWKGAGYRAIVYFCALTGFNQSLYEAAEIDGPTDDSVDQIMDTTNLNPLLPVPLRELSVLALLIFPRRSPLQLLEYPYKSIAVHKTGHLGDIGYF